MMAKIRFLRECMIRNKAIGLPMAKTMSPGSVLEIDDKYAEALADQFGDAVEILESKGGKAAPKGGK